ncbi:hypothetical protein A2U01_0030187, partial [Trifolium medium]|nr:hypothetical protein [Trifolium medium]
MFVLGSTVFPSLQHIVHANQGKLSLSLLDNYTHTPPFTHINISSSHAPTPKAVRLSTLKIPNFHSLSKSFKNSKNTMSKSTISSATKNIKDFPVPDEVLFSKITPAKPISAVTMEETRRLRTKSVAVRPKRVPKVSKNSSPSTSVKESSGRRLKSTAGRSKGLSKASFDFVGNPIESNTEGIVNTAAGMNFGTEILGKTSQNLGHDASPSVIRPTGGVFDNVAASTRANFESDDENVGTPDNETPK